MRVLLVLLFSLSVSTYAQTIHILDESTQQAISFATISFGDGRGTFAGDKGDFRFDSSIYSDIDTLYISSIGYAERAFPTALLKDKIYLSPEASQLDEVVLIGERRGRFKKVKRKETTHTEYFTSWLPTVESEVAVLFERENMQPTKIARLQLPINSEKEFRKKGNLTFSTLFRVQFYSNADGFPGKAMKHREIIFRVTEQDDKVFSLDINDHNIFIPEEGIFASLQVLGYADAQGKLIQTKKYNEIETPRGLQKISVTFRPLLPFTNKLPSQKTYVRRVFFNNKQWQIFDKTYNVNSNLVKMGFVNYGMGALLHVYKE